MLLGRGVPRSASRACTGPYGPGETVESHYSRHGRVEGEGQKARALELVLEQSALSPVWCPPDEPRGEFTPQVLTRFDHLAHFYD